MNISVCEDKERLISDEAYSVYSSCMYEPTYEKYRSRIDKYFSEPCYRVYLCEHGGKITGITVLHREGGGAEIVGIAVSERHRHRGIGRAMICYLTENSGIKMLTAQTDGDAVGFYRSCGFEIKEQITEYPDRTCIRYNCKLKTRK